MNQCELIQDITTKQSTELNVSPFFVHFHITGSSVNYAILSLFSCSSIPMSAVSNGFMITIGNVS